MKRSLSTALFIHGMNRGWKRMAKIQVPRDERRFGFTPQPSPRLDKIMRSFRMHLRRKAARGAPSGDGQASLPAAPLPKPLAAVEPAPSASGK